LFTLFTGEEATEDLSREFILSKLQNKIDVRDLLKNERSVSLIVDRVNDVFSFIEGILNSLETEEILRIYGDSTSEKLRKMGATKSEIFEEILNKIPSGDLIENKRLLKRMKPKYVSVTDIRPLRESLELLKKETSNVSDDIGLLSNRLASVEDSLKMTAVKLKTMDEVFDTAELPNLGHVLKVLYDESIKMGDKPSAESYQGLPDRLRAQLGVNRRSFVLSGSELLLVHYLMSIARNLYWRPPLESFAGILKEEFEKEGSIKDRIDIPSLRNHVSKRLAIDEEVFDEMLIEAWKRDLVKLEAGAPIGEFNIKYLVTQDGQKFYYVRRR